MTGSFGRDLSGKKSPGDDHRSASVQGGSVRDQQKRVTPGGLVVTGGGDRGDRAATFAASRAYGGDIKMDVARFQSQQTWDAPVP